MSEAPDDVAPGADPVPEAAAPVCSVTFTLDEEFTGFRTVTDTDGEESQVPTTAVSVTFTNGTVSHQREVNACFDADGNYDADATNVRIGEVAMGVEAKIAAGVITAS